MKRIKIMAVTYRKLRSLRDIIKMYDETHLEEEYKTVRKREEGRKGGKFTFVRVSKAIPAQKK